MNNLFCFGLGYSARALGQHLRQEGWYVGGTTRAPANAAALAADGFDAFVFDGTQPGSGVADALSRATHVVVSAPPDADGDPVLRHYAKALADSPVLEWVGYLSTIGVYGDRQGDWVDETTPPAPTSQRSQQRLAAENAWLDFGAKTNKRVDIFRLSGIYGPGRSAFDRLRNGTAQRIVKPGQVFNRIHVDDITQALCAAIAGRGIHRVYNVTDSEPAPPEDVVTFAAELLQIPPPPPVQFEHAELSPMAASFYGENKRVHNERLRQELGVALKFPSYREGLRAILTRD